MIELTNYDDARAGLRNRDLRQALYDEGHRLMTGVIVNLHGGQHLARRRLENRLFRRDTFAWYEREWIPSIIDSVLAPTIDAGRGDLLPMARRTMMRLSVDVAGVDLPEDSFEQFYGLMDRLAKASTVAHALGDRNEIVADGDAALTVFRDEFYRPSYERRAAIVGRLTRDEVTAADLPRDVLTTLLCNQDRLDLPDETMLREIAYFPWVGSHSTSAQLVHAMHHIFEWIAMHPDDRERLTTDHKLRQHFVHESMRLHPASPVAQRIAVTHTILKSGVTLNAGDCVTINIESANRDPLAVGANPSNFDPYRSLADGVAPWGLTFGTGSHACLGQELASGLEYDESLEHH
ncbi:cytochrome P450, partial [Ilumatobacter sp.]|uniref:cytochrome P450 n=1 Tax=Ilumatobacter sp. TaxID=1967498 RepID=UPI00374FF735